jgi:membrane protein YqaA with SNARE-associated domain
VSMSTEPDLVSEATTLEQATDKAVAKSARWLRSKCATAVLVAISFAESVFLPILIDPFLIALILAQPKRWRWFVGVSVAASTLGGIFAYWLGAMFFETFGGVILGWYGMEESFTWVTEQIARSGFVFVLIGAFTPIPYKIVALASGVLMIDFFTFLIASLVGRLFRLGLVGLATAYVGPQALPAVRRNLHRFAAIVGILLIMYLIAEWWLL